MNKCIIYGAGKWGQQAYNDYSSIVEVIAFLDSDKNKSGSTLYGVQIKCPEEMLDNKEAFVLIAVAKDEGINEYLLKLGYKEVFKYVPGYLIDINAYLSHKIQYYHIENQITTSPKINELVKIVADHDVISFDIFDTAVNRLVDNPQDIFRILGKQKKNNIFRKLRHDAEMSLREDKMSKIGTREVTLDEIYQQLNDKYEIPAAWQEDEINLELELTESNVFIHIVFEEAKKLGKHIVFTSDMYLPRIVIEKILESAGYNYEQLYISNERMASKEDGCLFELLKKDYPGLRLLHIGDNKKTDVDMAKQKGIDSFYFPKICLRKSNNHTSTLDSSFYNSIIRNHLFGSITSHNLHYEHGFRIGGILTVGYCKYINTLVKKNGIEKILFCGRDCRVISDVYNQFFKEVENDYIKISRRAILEVAGNRYLDDYIGRGFLRYLDDNNGNIGEILENTGFGYLVDAFDKADIELMAFPSEIVNLKERCIDVFINNRELISFNCEKKVTAAKKYYKELITDRKKILIVDIGWSGSCITILRDFLIKNMDVSDLEIYGALMCGSRSENYISATEGGIIESYIYSPFFNHDLEDIMMPINASIAEADRVHMPLEYLYTSIEKSLFSYELKGENVLFKEVENDPSNKDEIQEMQKGIMDFATIYSNTVDKYVDSISPYVAFQPFLDSLQYESYCRNVYKNFLYDVDKTPLEKNVFTFDDFLKGSEILKNNKEIIDCRVLNDKEIPVIVSLTSYPKRMNTIYQCIESLLKQTYKNIKVELWLSIDQFPNGEEDLPKEVWQYACEDKIEICWVEGDIKPHKKYFYTIQRHKGIPIITVDDDVIYEEDMVDILMDSYKKHPHAVSCTRAHYITHKKDGTLRKYKGWCHDVSRFVGEELNCIIPVGVGGVLYPPDSLPNSTFNYKAIVANCIEADDLWLKINALLNNTKAVLACEKECFKVIPNTQECALYKRNLDKNANDIALDNIVQSLDDTNRNKLYEKLVLKEGIYT